VVDEVPVEIETDVWLSWRIGRLVVTDRRIAFFMGGVLWRRRSVVAAPFRDIASAGVVESSRSKGWATLEVATNTALVELCPEIRDV